MKYLKELQVKFVESTTPNRVEGQVRKAEDVYTLFKDLEDDAKEKVLALYLDISNHVNSFEVLFIGSEHSCLMSPRQVFKGALLSNSPAFILVHNHPSGNSKPSHADLSIVDQISAASKVMDIQFLDFVVVARDGFWSWMDDTSYVSPS